MKLEGHERLAVTTSLVSFDPLDNIIVQNFGTFIDVITVTVDQIDTFSAHRLFSLCTTVSTVSICVCLKNRLRTVLDLLSSFGSKYSTFRNAV